MNDQLLPELAQEPERYELYELPYLADLNRRQFFRIVGSGVVIALLLPGQVTAQQPGPRRQRGGALPQEIGAWLHIGEDSAVTVYTGKVEIGQNIRTSLAQVVAEELQAPVERIRLVMADTALTPFDMGTFGSATTPMMASQLRRVAAAAREALLDLAAEKSKLERKTLAVVNGQIVGPKSETLFEFGQLTQGKKLMKVVAAETPTTAADKWEIAGTSVPKVDGRAFVTGAHAYAADVRRPGMLFGKVLRPASFKAKLVSVQTRDAEAMPGVKVVRDGDFVGVVAPTELAAAQALAAIHAEWQTVAQPSGDELFQHLKTHPSAGRGGFGSGSPEAKGSVQEGLRAADQTVQATYTVAYIAHVPLEPRVAVAEWSAGKLTVWTGTQRPFGIRGDLAGALGLAPDQIRVIAPDMGSGYGGKHTNEAAAEAAKLARAAGKPVKVLWTREEEFSWAYFRPAGVIDVTAGARNDGTLIAWEFHNYNSGGSALRSPYEAPHQEVRFHGADSPLRQGSYRALAATANHFARESVMDELAYAVKAEPLAFRLKNLKDDRLRAVLEAAAGQFGWGKTKPAAGHGFGIAGGTEKRSYVATCAEVAVDRSNGRVQVLRLVTAFEAGAILNPDHLKNQVEGAAVMGLGGALFEEIKFANGKILNPNFEGYRVPRFRDVPILETVLVNRKDLPSAGAGETPIVAVAPAVGNAIFHATGVRLRSLPMVPNGFKAG
jgi:isoquinoline 1-oxidoreductase